MGCIVFFKQKTAYEMRISDWSSDVCSSDLQVAEGAAHQVVERPGGRAGGVRLDPRPVAGRVGQQQREQLIVRAVEIELQLAVLVERAHRVDRRGAVAVLSQALGPELAEPGAEPRSEEHTSELQSLMRPSYA